MPVIDLELYNRFNDLGLIPNNVRKDNVGKSDYAKHTIQPWSIWKDYNLNPWDADIVKRILRTKEEEGMSETEARIMDYKKIKHICDERIRQLEFSPMNDIAIPFGSIKVLDPMTSFLISPTKLSNEANITYTLKGSEIKAYNDFCNLHKCCKGSINVTFSHESGLGTTVKVKCSGCGEEADITDVSKW